MVMNSNYRELDDYRCLNNPVHFLVPVLDGMGRSGSRGRQKGGEGKDKNQCAGPRCVLNGREIYFSVCLFKPLGRSLQTQPGGDVTAQTQFTGQLSTSAPAWRHLSDVPEDAPLWGGGFS